MIISEFSQSTRLEKQRYFAPNTHDSLCTLLALYRLLMFIIDRRIWISRLLFNLLSLGLQLFNLNLLTTKIYIDARANVFKSQYTSSLSTQLLVIFQILFLPMKQCSPVNINTGLHSRSHFSALLIVCRPTTTTWFHTCYKALTL